MIYRDYISIDSVNFKPDKSFKEFEVINFKHLIRQWETSKLVWFKTIVIDDEIVGFSSCEKRADHIGEVRFIFNELFYEKISKCLKYFIKNCRKELEVLPFDRIQTSCYNGYYKAEKLLRVLGFKEEGVALKAGMNKEDIKIFARIK